MLNWVRETLRKSKAAVVVENLFRELPVPFIIPGGPSKFANSLIEKAWDCYQEYFSGKRAPAPHHMKVAAVSLAVGMEDNRSCLVTHTTCKGALGILLAELTVNRFQYALNGVDLSLLDLASERYANEEWAKTICPQDDLMTGPPARNASEASVSHRIDPIDAALQQRKIDIQERLKSFPSTSANTIQPR